jgi:hypothetical protein
MTAVVERLRVRRAKRTTRRMLLAHVDCNTTQSRKPGTPARARKEMWEFSGSRGRTGRSRIKEQQTVTIPSKRKQTAETT